MPNINRCFFTIPVASGGAGGAFFSQAPCISQAPFHVPIRGGYQGGARLSKMDCSDTTQSSPVVLGTRFKMLWLGLECRSKTQRTAFSHALTKEEPLMRPLILGDLSKRTQTRSGSGVVFNFVVGCSNISLLEGWLLTRYCESHFCQLRFTQEQSAKVGLCKTAPARHTSTFL